MGLDEKQLDRVRARLEREFPELAGAQPQISAQPGRGKGAQYQVVFRGFAELPGGRRLERVVRATVDEHGRILKWTTSR